VQTIEIQSEILEGTTSEMVQVVLVGNLVLAPLVVVDSDVDVQVRAASVGIGAALTEPRQKTGLVREGAVLSHLEVTIVAAVDNVRARTAVVLGRSDKFDTAAVVPLELIAGRETTENVIVLKVAAVESLRGLVAGVVDGGEGDLIAMVEIIRDADLIGTTKREIKLGT
jgi:hypothetical protein